MMTAKNAFFAVFSRNFRMLITIVGYIDTVEPTLHYLFKGASTDPLITSKKEKPTGVSVGFFFLLFE